MLSDFFFAAAGNVLLVSLTLMKIFAKTIGKTLINKSNENTDYLEDCGASALA